MLKNLALKQQKKKSIYLNYELLKNKHTKYVKEAKEV